MGWVMDKIFCWFPPQDKYGAMARCLLYVLIWQSPIIIFAMWPDKIDKFLVRLRAMFLRVAAAIIVMFLPPYLIDLSIKTIGRWLLPLMNLSSNDVAWCYYRITWIWIIAYEISLLGFFLLWRRYTRNYTVWARLRSMSNSLVHDSPITTETEDLFHREPFVQALVDSIVRANVGKEAEYIGVFGDWGSGKTSVMNLVKLKFQSKDDVCEGMDAVFVDANPWAFRNSDDAICGFLRKLIHVLDENGEKKAAVAFRAYSRMISLRRIEVKGGIVGEMLEGVRQWFFAFVYDEDKSISMVKKSLLDMEKRLVIVIDDLERLPSKDVCSVISFIRANLDFPNVVVVFLSDRKYLARSLSSLINRNDNEDIERLGLSYLSKIIQRQHDLPELSSDVVISFFKEGLKRLVSGVDLLGYDIESDDGLRFDTVRHYVNTVRDAKILLAKLWSEISLQKNSTRSSALTLHVGDLVALTVLRIWSNDVYKDLKGLIDKLLAGYFGGDLAATLGMTSEEIDKWIQDREKNIQYRPFIREFLEKRIGLIPTEDHANNVRYMLSGMNDPETRASCRLASSDYYKMYFEDFQNVKYISKEILSRFLSSIRNNIVPMQLVEECIRDKSLPLFLRTLEGIKEADVGGATGTYFRTLIRLSNRPFLDEFVVPSEEQTMGYVHPNIYDVYLAIGRCIKLYLERCGETRGRGRNTLVDSTSLRISRSGAGEILADEALKDPSVYLLWQFISWDEKRHGDTNARYDGRIFSHDRFKQLLTCYLDQVEKMQKDDKLFVSNVFFDLFRAWNMVLDRVKDDQRRLNMQGSIQGSLQSVSNIEKIYPFLVRSPARFGDGMMIDNVHFLGIDEIYVEKHFGFVLLRVITTTLEKQRDVSPALRILGYALDFVIQNKFDKEKCQFEKQYNYVKSRLNQEAIDK